MTVWSREGARHVLVVLHHIVCDAWSLAIFARELAECLQARRQARMPRLPTLELQYSDYARWQRASTDADRRAEHAAYWRTLLGGAPEVSIPMGPTAARAAEVELDPRLVRELEELVQRAQVTMFTVVLCAWLRVLAEESGQPDQIVGFPISTRDDPRLEPLVGYFVNHLCVRVRAAGEVGPLLETVRAQLAGMQAHKDISLDEHLTDSQRARLYQFRLNFITGDAVVRGEGEVLAAAHRAPRLATRSPFDLSLDVDHRPGNLWIGLRHAGLSAESVARIVGRVVDALRALGRA